VIAQSFSTSSPSFLHFHFLPSNQLHHFGLTIKWVGGWHFMTAILDVCFVWFYNDDFGGDKTEMTRLKDGKGKGKSWKNEEEADE
jgi:hypothetical protein